MASEPMTDVPGDLATAWSFAVCPKGKRSLVVSGEGGSAAYTGSGYRWSERRGAQSHSAPR